MPASTKATPLRTSPIFLTVRGLAPLAIDVEHASIARSKARRQGPRERERLSGWHDRKQHIGVRDLTVGPIPTMPASSARLRLAALHPSSGVVRLDPMLHEAPPNHPRPMFLAR